MASETNEEGGPGQIYAKFVDDAEKIMRQFSTPVMSANLLNKMTSQQLWPDTAPAEWSTYHQITNVQRLQLEKMFEIIQSIDENACSGWQPQRIWCGTRIEILRQILMSLASLMFVRTSTIVTMGTYGKKSFEYNGKKELAAQLVSNEGIASLKADCALASLPFNTWFIRYLTTVVRITYQHITQILKLITKLTESPTPK